MKILQIFGAVVAVHLLAFIFIFASPGCQSPTNIPTPDATMPTASASTSMGFNVPNAAPQPVDLGTSVTTYSPESDHASPTRPGSPAAMAVTPAKSAQEVSPVSAYTVDRGDSLWSIAKKNNLSVSELAKANKMTTGTVLKPGQKLMIPGKVGAAPVVAAAAVAADKVAEKPVAHVASGESVKHTVQPGESLGTIARKYQVRTADLAMANNITDPSKVRAGQQLTIPGFTAVTPKAKSPAPAASPAPATSKAAPTGKTPAAAETPAPTAASMTPHFEISAPPAGQDLDSGLKDASTEVPTIKVEEAKP